MHLQDIISNFKRMASAISPRKWAYIAAGLVLLIAAIVLLTSRGAQDPMDSQEIAEILDRGALRSGVRVDVPSFGTTDENGNHAGLEADLLRLLSQEVFGTESVEFTVVNYNTLSSSLRTGSLDVAAALYQQGLSTSLVYSEPYYTDAIALMVLRDSPYTATEQLKEATIGCINRDGTNMRYIARNAAYELVGSTGSVVEYSGVPDMLEDLSAGRIDAVCMEYALLYSYYSENTHRILPEAIDTVSYSFVFSPGSSQLAKVANAMLERMKNDGSLDALIAKWNLSDYS